jgi:CBS domain-containing protein
MRVKDAMTRNVVTVTADTPVTEAMQLMLQHGISGVPVVDGTGRLLGILTDGDLVRRVAIDGGRRPWWLARGASPEEIAVAYVKTHGTKVGDAMTKDVLTADEDEPLDAIAMRLESKGVKRLPVVKNGKIEGIISRANLLRAMAAGGLASDAADDDSLRLAILRGIGANPGVRAQLLDVTAVGGVAHLWGNVASKAERDAVRVIAETTAGVRAVKDHVRVLPASFVDYKPE